jgi:hypothetical protein
MENIMKERSLFHYTGSAAVLGLLSAMWVITPADARITGITITAQTSPAFSSQSFGAAGQYEQLDGTATGEIDPKDPSMASFRTSSLRRAIPAEWSSIRWTFRS